MAIVYPRDFPMHRFRAANFRLARRTQRNELYSGAVIAIEQVDPLWIASYATVPLTAAERAAWKAWEESLKGGTKFFYGYDPERVWPLAYGAGVLALTRHAGGAFDGTATLTSASGHAIALSNLPSTYQVKAGDHVSIPMASSQRSLHRAVEDATASAGAVTIAVEPAVRAGASTGQATVQLVRPTCIMVLKHETFEAPGEVSPASVSFEAVQTLA